MDRDSEQMEVGREEVFSIPGPCLTDVNYSNDQQGESPPSHPSVVDPSQDPIVPEGEGVRTRRREER